MVYVGFGVLSLALSLVKTDWYWCDRISPFYCASSHSAPCLFFYGGVPISSFCFDLIYAHAFLFIPLVPSEKIPLTYSLCASRSWFFRSLVSLCYRFLSIVCATVSRLYFFIVFFSFTLARFRLLVRRRIVVFTQGNLLLWRIVLCGMCFFVML